MKKLWIILLLGILVSGCGIENRVSNDDPVKGKNKGGQGIVAGEMDSSMTEPSPLIFNYVLKNQTEKDVTLKFTSSQRYDYSIKQKMARRLLMGL